MPTLDRIPTFFTKWVQAHGAAGPAGSVAHWLAAGNLEPSGFAEIVARHGTGREEWFRLNLLDLVIEYVGHRLSEGLLSIDDNSDIRLLKHALHIREGELVSHRPAELSQLFQISLSKILEDDQIDAQEDLYLVSLQAAFDLSYDQFLTLARPAFEREIASLDERIDSEKRAKSTLCQPLERKRSGLSAMFLLVQQQRRSLGSLY